MTRFLYDVPRRHYIMSDADDLTCGTLAGFHQHHRARQTPCGDCVDAMRRAVQAWR